MTFMYEQVSIMVHYYNGTDVFIYIFYNVSYLHIPRKVYLRSTGQTDVSICYVDVSVIRRFCFAQICRSSLYYFNISFVSYLPARINYFWLKSLLLNISCLKNWRNLFHLDQSLHMCKPPSFFGATLYRSASSSS
jgi:hypothetical protein